MKFKYKKVKSYERELLDAIQAALGDNSLGLSTNGKEIIITDNKGIEINLTTDQINKVKTLTKFKERLE